MTSLIIVGAGPPSRAGGVDLFLELIATITVRASPGFVWLGGRPRAAARRLDAEIHLLGERGHVDWLPHGLAPPGSGVVLAITARTADAARVALSAAPAGTPMVGLESDIEVTRVLRAAGASTVRYPDVPGLGEQLLGAAGQNSSLMPP